MSRASTSKLAVGLGLLMLVLFAASAPLGSSAHKSFFGGGGGIGLLFMPFAVVGLIVAWRQPRNSIGWILLALATMMILSTDAGLYSVIAFQLGHPSIPLARVATALTQTWIALVGVAAVADPVVPGRSAAVASVALVVLVVPAVQCDVRRRNCRAGLACVHRQGCARRLVRRAEKPGHVVGFRRGVVPGDLRRHRAVVGDRQDRGVPALDRRASPAAEVVDVWRRSQFRRALPHVVPQRRLRVRRRRRPADLDRSRDPEVPAVRHRPSDQPHAVVRDRDWVARRGVSRPGRSRRPTCCRSRRRSGSLLRRWRPLRCSRRCAAGPAGRSTAVSTAPATTQRRPSVRSPGGCATRSISRRSR